MTDTSQPLLGSKRRLAVALSGGGHRATLFALGALLYLVDAGRQRETTSIASVSGGSLANGFIAQAVDFQQVDSAQFEAKVVAPLAGQIANQGTLFAPLLTKLYLLILVIGFAAIFSPFWLLRTPWWTRIVVWLVLLIAWAWLFGQRGRVCARAFAVTLFSPSGRPTLPRDISTSLAHVICATELRASESMYFAGDFVYGFQFGPGVPGDLPLHQAVQASAAFPGAFPPAHLSTRTHKFGDPRGTLPHIPRSLILSDGGVYDNMADEWARGFQRRSEVWPWLARHKPAPNQIVVINSSARVPWRPFRMGGIPLLGELATLLRVNDVMYINTTNVRRQEIVKSFDPVHPQETEAGMPGALIQIAQSPFVVADAYSQWADKPVGTRAANVIQALGPNSRDEWQRIASENAAVPTTLRKLGREVSARLLRHGYVLAMCNLHVILGGNGAGQEEWPLMAVPPLSRFSTLVEQAP